MAWVAIALSLAACGDAGATSTEPDAGASRDAGAHDAGTASDASRDRDGGADGDGGARDDASMPGDAGTDPMRVETPPLPGEVSFDPALPTDDEGRPVVSDTGPVVTVVDPDHVAGPIDALARCAARLLLCEAEGHTLDTCVVSVPRCATARPWEESDACCPAACASRYAADRAAGMADGEAIEGALFGASSCVDGVDGMRRGETP